MGGEGGIYFYVYIPIIQTTYDIVIFGGKELVIIIFFLGGVYFYVYIPIIRTTYNIVIFGGKELVIIFFFFFFGGGGGGILLCLHPYNSNY